MGKRAETQKYDFSQELGLKGLTRTIVKAIARRVTGGESYDPYQDIMRAQDLGFKGWG